MPDPVTRLNTALEGRYAIERVRDQSRVDSPTGARPGEWPSREDALRDA